LLHNDKLGYITVAGGIVTSEVDLDSSGFGWILMWGLESCDLSVVKQRSGLLIIIRSINQTMQQKRKGVKFTKAMSLAHPKIKSSLIILFRFYQMSSELYLHKVL
jgi:hypothetical protein